jgi:hypothetical protein
MIPSTPLIGMRIMAGLPDAASIDGAACSGDRAFP